MTPSELMCPHCGWRNEGTARMCGGCGQPLRDSSAVPLRPASGSPYGAASYANDAPTSLSSGVGAPRDARAVPPGGGNPAAWPGPGNAAGASQAPRSAPGWPRALLASGGGIKASGRTVTGALSVFESGDEMEAALNAGLANWPRTDNVTDVHTDGDTLIVSLGR